MINLDEIERRHKADENQNCEGCTTYSAEGYYVEMRPWPCDAAVLLAELRNAIRCDIRTVESLEATVREQAASILALQIHDLEEALREAKTALIQGYPLFAQRIVDSRLAGAERTPEALS